MTRLLALLTLAAVATGCGADTGVAGEVQPAGGLTVVASVYPLAWMAAEIAPDATVTPLAAEGQDPHALELSPGDRQLVETADVVLHVGDIGFQPQVEQALSDAGGEVVSAAEVVGHDALLPLAGRDHDDHADDDHDGDDHEADGAVDPHLWFDAGLLAEVAEAAGAAFAAADPAGADAYTAAAAELAADLEALDAEVAALLDDCAHDRVVVGHEAFAYLLEPHGLHQEGISGAAGHAAASPQRIAALVELIREEGIPAVLSEPVEGRADAEAVAAEAGVEVIDVLALGLVTQEQAAAGYPALLREQAAAVARAADCGS